MKILKLIGLLLDYPDESLWAHQEELLALAVQQQPSLLPFLHRYLTARPLDKQADWCALFERGRATSLLLFEHVHAQSRDRGQAMVDLLAQYEQAGLALKRRELPDYLPLYLEYLSLRPAGEARQGLLDIAPILALVGGRLQQRQSDYSALFDALLTLANSPLSSNGMAQQIAGEPRDDTRDALDAVWEEERVTFMGDNPCNSSAVRQHQRRCRDDVQLYYLHPTAGGKR